MATDPHAINIESREQLAVALAARSWDVYAVGATEVIRSPDRKVLIISNLCSVQDVVAMVSHFEPPLPRVTRDN